MGVGEQHATGGKSIDVGRLSLWVSAKAANPVVQIIDRNEQYVGPRLRLIRRQIRRANVRAQERDPYRKRSFQ